MNTHEKVEEVLAILIKSMQILSALEVAVRSEDEKLADNLRLLLNDLDGRLEDCLWLMRDGTIDRTFLS